MITSTVEDYLKTILLQSQAGAVNMVSMGQIGAALGVAPGTVTAMVKTLAAGDLVTYEPYTGVALTGAGQRLATHVLRRHRLIELFLVQVLGIDWGDVHEEAELLEHAVSDRLIERMDEMLGYPDVDPHGDPIPSALGEVSETRYETLLGCPLGTPQQVARVVDQGAEFLQLLERQGLKPGSEVCVSERSDASDTLTLQTPTGGEFQLGYRAASKVLVRNAVPAA